MQSTLNGPGYTEHPLQKQNTDNLLNFYGVVRDNYATPMEGAIVIVLACFEGGITSPLGYTFTDREGNYLLTLPKPTEYHTLTGFKVKAAKTGLFPEEDGNWSGISREELVNVEEANNPVSQEKIEITSPIEEVELINPVEVVELTNPVEIVELTYPLEEVEKVNSVENVWKVNPAEEKTDYKVGEIKTVYQKQTNTKQDMIKVTIPLNQATDDKEEKISTDFSPYVNNRYISENEVGESGNLNQQFDYKVTGNCSGSIVYVKGGQIHFTVFGS